MILLCDLDGTLLSNSMAAFQPSYLKALGAFLSEKVHPDKMIPELLSGTRKMLENCDPLMTLESAFDQRFYPGLGFEKREISDLIMDFYHQEFPSLGRLTRQLPDAIEFVTSRISAGDHVVVATNPLFPRVATFARLVWAGLPVDHTQFELVTTYEFMHFAKPHSAYYAEILAYLGYPDEPVLMIGNDLDDDILAAQKLGIPGFWLTLSEPIQGNYGAYHHSGTYQNLADFLVKDFQPDNIYQTSSLPALFSFLKATLAALHTYSTCSDILLDDKTEISLRSLISGRFRDEIAMVEKSPVSDKLSLNNDYNTMTELTAFTRYRLEWMELISSLHAEGNVTPASESYLFLQSCIADDRKLMMECAQWFKERPKFVNHDTQTPC